MVKRSLTENFLKKKTTALTIMRMRITETMRPVPRLPRPDWVLGRGAAGRISVFTSNMMRAEDLRLSARPVEARTVRLTSW